MIVELNKKKGKEIHKSYVDMTLKEFIDMLSHQNIQDGIDVQYIPIDFDKENKLMIVTWR